MTLLQEMKVARVLGGFSNEDCGNALGVSRETYRKRESGEAEVTGLELAVLARKLYKKPLHEVFPSYRPSEAEVIFLEEVGRKAET